MRHIDNVRQHSSATSVADHETSLESFEGSFGRKPHLQASIPLAVLVDQWLSSCHSHGTCHLLTSQLEVVVYSNWCLLFRVKHEHN